jgi:hypothetical protein
MPTSKPNVLRKIAEQQLDGCFNGLAGATRNELATSIVRQWLTYEGAAVLLNLEQNFWFRLTRLENGMTQVVRDIQPSSFSEQIRRSGAAAAEIPGLLHELTLCQNARCRAENGAALQMRVDPATAEFTIEFVPDAEADVED